MSPFCSEFLKSSIKSPSKMKPAPLSYLDGLLKTSQPQCLSSHISTSPRFHVLPSSSMAHHIKAPDLIGEYASKYGIPHFIQLNDQGPNAKPVEQIFHQGRVPSPRNQHTKLPTKPTTQIESHTQQD